MKPVDSPSAPTVCAHLLAPGRIGTLDIRNRIVMSPMGSNLAEANGHVGERLTRYYEARAKGGVGLIIVGVGAVAYPAGACIPNQVAISDDVFLPGLQNLTRCVHAHGAKIAIQLQHSGKVATQDMAAGRPLWVPSLVPMKAGDLLDDLTMEEVQGLTGYLAQPGAGIVFHEMTLADIQQLVAWFAAAAERARRGGFDAVEIHGAHGYLLSSFLSPAYNRRADEYGGALENRARLLVEVLQAVRQRVGAAFPVWCRLDAQEFRIKGGITVDDAQRVAVMAVAAGADAIHVSAYAEPTSGVAFTDAPLVHQPCGFVDFAAAIKQRVTVPVIAVGRIEPAEADALIAAGKADFVAMARKLLADPELPAKLSEGRAADIRPCIYCYRCVGNIYLNASVACGVRPATGREALFAITPAVAPKRVLVAGGGPAGMEAARLAALRGHAVTLCEKAERLGGAALRAGLVYEPNGKLVEYLERQVRALPVDVRMRQEVTAALVRELQPDVVLVAVGGCRAAWSVPGSERVHVVGADDLHQALALGYRVAVIGGGLIGIEVAEYLSERGHQVTVLEASLSLATEMALPRRWRALYTLRERGVLLVTGATVEEVSDAGVVYRQHGERRVAPADHVILAGTVVANRSLGDALATCGAEVHLLGDCKGAGYIEGAMLDAARVALAL